MKATWLWWEAYSQLEALSNFSLFFFFFAMWQQCLSRVWPWWDSILWLKTQCYREASGEAFVCLSISPFSVLGTEKQKCFNTSDWNIHNFKTVHLFATNAVVPTSLRQNYILFFSFFYYHGWSMMLFIFDPESDDAVTSLFADISNCQESIFWLSPSLSMQPQINFQLGPTKVMLKESITSLPFWVNMSLRAWLCWFSLYNIMSTRPYL